MATTGTSKSRQSVSGSLSSSIGFYRQKKCADVPKPQYARPMTKDRTTDRHDPRPGKSRPIPSNPIKKPFMRSRPTNPMPRDARPSFRAQREQGPSMMPMTFSTICQVTPNDALKTKPAETPHRSLMCASVPLRALQSSLPNLPQPPRHRIDPPCKVQHRRHSRQRNPQRPAHCVPLDLTLRLLQRPRHMMDVGDVNPAVPHACEQAVPLGQPMLNRPRPRRTHRPDRPIRGRKLRPAAPALHALRRVLDRVVPPLAPDGRPVIRQAIGKSRNSHSRRARRIETQKPHPCPFSAPHVCPHIDLRKRRQPRQRRQHSMPDARHPKRHNPDPRLPVERVNLDIRRNHPPQRRRVDWPVRKKQIMPDHLHPPRQRRQRPGTMVDHSQECGIHDARGAYANRHFRASETSIQSPAPGISQPPQIPLDARAIITLLRFAPVPFAAGSVPPEPPGVLQ